MEQNTDRMGFALIALSIVAVVLIVMNTIFLPTVKSYFQGLQKWSNTVTNQLNPPQQYEHKAYSWSADGKTDFSINLPNVNLISNSSFLNYQKVDSSTYKVTTMPNGGFNNNPYLRIITTSNDGVNYRDIGILNLTQSDIPSSWTGKVFTFSFYSRGNASLRTHIYPNFIDNSIIGTVDGTKIRPQTDGMNDWNLTSSWVRHSYTFTSKQQMTSYMAVIFRVFKGNSVDVCLPKLEISDTATHADDPTKYTWTKIN